MGLLNGIPMAEQLGATKFLCTRLNECNGNEKDENIIEIEKSVQLVKLVDMYKCRLQFFCIRFGLTGDRK